MDYEVNVYLGSTKIDRTIDFDIDITEQGQSETIRETLERFKRAPMDLEALRAVHNPGQYAAEFSDDVPLDNQTINTLLDMPDLSDLDSMEMQDLINSESSIHSKDDFEKLINPPKETINPVGVSSSQSNGSQNVDNQ